MIADTITLSQLLAGQAASLSGDCQLTGLCMNSSLVSEGDAFIAIAGTQSHGAKFAADAVANGAVAIIHDGKAALPSLPDAVAVAELAGLADVLGLLAAGFYQSREACQLMAVTGTNGKTSCAWNYAAIRTQLGSPCGLIGTLGWGIAPKLQDTGLTTPDVLTVHKSIANLCQQNCEAVALEASSHALDQGRLDGLQIGTAVFTNLSRDHLDYHEDLESYAAAKARLFYRPELKHAVINLDDDYGRRLAEDRAISASLCTYSIEGAADAMLQANNIRLDASGIQAELHTPWGEAAVCFRQFGRFNLHNHLAVIAALCLEGLSLDAVLAAFDTVPAVPGRMQSLQADPGPAVLIDYAHTPDALEKALQALSEHYLANLWLVFGCGGDRDKGKRAEMAAIAARLAQQIIVTSDNPRSEDPQAIIADILKGMPEVLPQGSKLHTQADRRRAIEYAVGQAGEQDCVLIAGKGHENYQLIKGEKLPFDDALVAQAALAARAQQRGMPA